MSGFFLLADQRAQIEHSGVRQQSGVAAGVALGCSAKRPNEDIDQVTTALTSAQDVIDALSSGQASSSTNDSKDCACIVCLEIGCPHSRDNEGFRCHVEGCDYTGEFYSHDHLSLHEKSHYTQGPIIFEPPYYCPVTNCRFSSKRWPDLCRHTTTKHCNNPVKFECSVIGCKYHGEGNGFTRKDKLTDHCRKMHRGQVVPRQVVRTLKPAPASFHAEASGSGSISALGN